MDWALEECLLLVAGLLLYLIQSLYNFRANHHANFHQLMLYILISQHCLHHFFPWHRQLSQWCPLYHWISSHPSWSVHYHHLLDAEMQAWGRHLSLWCPDGANAWTLCSSSSPSFVLCLVSCLGESGSQWIYSRVINCTSVVSSNALITWPTVRIFCISVPCPETSMNWWCCPAGKSSNFSNFSFGFITMSPTDIASDGQPVMDHGYGCQKFSLWRFHTCLGGGWQVCDRFSPEHSYTHSTVSTTTQTQCRVCEFVSTCQGGENHLDTLKQACYTPHTIWYKPIEMGNLLCWVRVSVFQCSSAVSVTTWMTPRWV